MLLFNQQIFDEIITGSGTTWYSSAQHNAMLGSADQSLIFGYVANVSGTSPTVGIDWDHSADGQDWVTRTGTTPVVVVNGQMIIGRHDGTLPYMRLKISLTGTNPNCRLRLWASGRSL